MDITLHMFVQGNATFAILTFIQLPQFMRRFKRCVCYLQRFVVCVWKFQLHFLIKSLKWQILTQSSTDIKEPNKCSIMIFWRARIQLSAATSARDWVSAQTEYNVF